MRERPRALIRAWQLPAMLGCSTVCPNCQHTFTCCQPTPCCKNDDALVQRRSLLSGGGLTTPAAAACFSPQISPSAPLSFVIPYPIPTLPPTSSVLLVQDCRRPELDLQTLAKTSQLLELSGWYYEDFSYQKSQELLKKSKVGTFLVRDSSNSQFLYSLSVQTEKGPTSVRLFYSNGYFRLDAQLHLQATMPVFPNVVELVQYYVAQSRRRQNDALVWVDPMGRCYSSIILNEPLRKPGEACSLKHMARLAVNRTQISDATKAELPVLLREYLEEYPYSV